MLPLADAALLAADPRATAALQRKATTEETSALRGIAREFESLFLELLLKNMRATTFPGGFLDSEATRLYRELADQELARSLVHSGKGLGLADKLAIQLQARNREAEVPAAPGGALPLRWQSLPLPLKRELPGSDITPLPPSATPRPATAKAFVEAVWEPAVAAARQIRVPPAFLVAQAALESGWGQRELRLPDGRTSHNVFGIKAGGDWSGPSVEATTTEYENGLPTLRTARFRAYDSYAEAFADYARLLTQSRRYAKAVGAADYATFARALREAGYATDPAYEQKLLRVMTSSLFQEALA